MEKHDRALSIGPSRTRRPRWSRRARTTLVATTLGALVTSAVTGQGASAEPPGLAGETTRTFRNPILPGFHPDPSICRVGDDYYLVTSSFELFPGVPIFHSRDLVHWRALGHVLSRPSQLDLDGVAPSDGIYAPTLRCHGGTFYMVTTLVRRNPDRYLNFVVTARDPAGPWSEPHVLSTSHYRIDPSLFFDDDGKAYFVANRTVKPAPYPSHRLIALQELDLSTMKLVGTPVDIGEGHARFAYAPEAPHIYKKDGLYYLLIAEGGTFETHAVTISRARQIRGPYVQHQGNPILTHRHLGPGADIHSTGHADLVETPAGWWMVALGMRGQPGERTGEGHCCSLGRETFLVPVTWDKPGAKLEDAEGWPVVNPGVGRILAEERAPALPPWTPPSEPSCDHFDRKVLGPAWSFVRTPREPLHSLEARPGFLRLTLARHDLDGAVAPAFVGRRVQHGSYSVRARLEFRPRGEREVAGLLVRNGRHHLRLVRARGAKGDVVQLVRHTTEDQLLAEAPAPAGALHLKIEARGETDYTFWFAAEPEAWVPLGGRVDGRLLGHKAPGALFTGSLVGMYASAEGHASHTKADFDYFEYRSE